MFAQTRHRQPADYKLRLFSFINEFALSCSIENAKRTTLQLVSRNSIIRCAHFVVQQGKLCDASSVLLIEKYQVAYAQCVA